jgi:hypothetical protein
MALATPPVSSRAASLVGSIFNALEPSAAAPPLAGD